MLSRICCQILKLDRYLIFIVNERFHLFLSIYRYISRILTEVVSKATLRCISAHPYKRFIEVWLMYNKIYIPKVCNLMIFHVCTYEIAFKLMNTCISNPLIVPLSITTQFLWQRREENAVGKSLFNKCFWEIK